MLKESEILRFIKEDEMSSKKKKAKIGQKYYEAEHDILDFRMFYYNKDGELVEDNIRSNSRICHPFFTELVDQQVQYMLSTKDRYIKSDNTALQARLDDYFDDDFTAELSECLTGAITKGFDYIHAYKTKGDKLAFECADSLGVIEVRAKDTDDGCQYIIYWYIDRIEKGQKEIKRIKVADDTQTWFYVQVDENTIELDETEEVNPRPHYVYKKGDSGEKYWKPLGFVPFFRLDNNKKQTSGLKPIKTLIDDYDLMACGLSNNLKDFDTPIHVVKGFQGDNLDELQVNLKTKKVVGTDAEGGIEVHTVDVPYQARETKLNLDEKNIYRFGMGFNSAQLGDGNITNVVIKSRYALLDLKCNKLEIRLKQFLKKIIQVVLNEINEADDTGYTLKDVYFDFTREVITNAQDNAQIELIDAQKQQIEINILLSLATVLGDELVVQNICEVLDLEYEEIKDMIPKGEEDLDSVEDMVDEIVPDDLGGDVIE